MKPINVKSSTYIEFGVENKDKDPKFGDHVRISKYKYIWAKGYENVRNKKVENALPCTYVISDLNDEEIVRTFYRKELKKNK